MSTQTIDKVGAVGTVVAELRGPDGRLKARCTERNVVTQVGDQMYAERGAGISGAPAVPTGMKLGTGSTAASKTGAGAALVAYLGDSHQAFDSGFPSSALNGSARRITYRCTFAAGKATTSSAITEAVIVNEALTNASSAAANTAHRVLLSGIASKGADDALTLVWTYDLS